RRFPECGRATGRQWAAWLGWGLRAPRPGRTQSTSGAGVSGHPSSQTEGDAMPQTVKGVISRSKGVPVELTDIVIPDPGPGEVIVCVRSCAVVLPDFHYREV